MPNAILLETATGVDTARPGLYVVQSGTPAYFPALALIEDGFARFLGELYDEGSKLVTLEVLPTSEALSNGRLGAEPEVEHRMITIGQQFFITALKDYDDWTIKWWREVVQNSVDAGAHNVALGSETLEDGDTLVYCDDDGAGMDRETVLEKFLVLGGTTKVAGSTAGGFGKAKELLLLPWIKWRIHTRDLLLEGSASAGYDVRPAPYHHGTRVEVIMPPDQHTDHVAALAFLEKCYLPNVSFTVNGEPALADLLGQNLINSVPNKADIYFTPAVDKQSYMYVRTRGLFMFKQYIGAVPGYVIVELTAPSVEILTANRDGFRDREVSQSIAQLAEKIAKDNLSALQAKQGIIHKKYEGTGKFRAKQMAAELLDQIGPSQTKLSSTDTEGLLAALGAFAQRDEAMHGATQLPSMATVVAMLDQKFDGPNHIEAAMKQLVWEPDFYLINEIGGRSVPRKFFPETMTPTVMKLAKTWVELCRFVLIQLGSDTQFGVGFIFSHYTAAAAVTEGDRYALSQWLVLNPYKNMYDGPIWRPTQNADLKWLYAAAIHEATHIADGINYHDESFASALTRNMARCADGYRRIKKIVGGIRMRGGIEAD